MRVLQLMSHLNVGGITRYVLMLSQQLRERGHQVIVAADGGHMEAQLRHLHVTHWRLPLGTSAEFSPQVWWGLRQLQAKLRDEPVDVIHAHTRVAQVLAQAASTRWQIPYVTTWHGIYRRRLGRRLWPCTGRFTIAISELVRQHLLQEFQIPPQQIRNIYNGIDAAHYASRPDEAILDTYRSRWQLPPGQPVIGSIGRMASGRVKGFDTLLVAATLLDGGLSNAQILLVGDGPRRPFLEDIAKRLGVTPRVHFVGTGEDIRLPLALMDAFVFTSRWPEAFGLTLLEAMAAGKPVVATNAGAVPEVVRHGVDGWLVPVDDPAAMAQGISRLLSDRALALQLGHQAEQRVREAFDLDRMVNEIEAVYGEAVKEDASAVGMRETR